MDPTANLREQKRLRDQIQRHINNDIEPYEYEDDVQRLVELQDALYEWLATGGAPPEWRVWNGNAALRA